MIKIEEKELKALQEKATTVKVMLENFDPNSQEEIDFIRSIASDLSDKFSKIRVSSVQKEIEDLQNQGCTNDEIQEAISNDLGHKKLNIVEHYENNSANASA